MISVLAFTVPLTVVPLAKVIDSAPVFASNEAIVPACSAPSFTPDGQAIERHRELKERMQEQLAELAAEDEAERERDLAADDKIAEVRDGLARIRVLVAGAQSRLDGAERAVRAERERNADLDRALREAQFSLRESAGKLQDIFAQ